MEAVIKTIILSCNDTKQSNTVAERNNWSLVANAQELSYPDAVLTGTLLNRIIAAQWEGMGNEGLARYEPAILPPCRP